MHIVTQLPQHKHLHEESNARRGQRCEQQEISKLWCCMMIFHTLCVVLLVEMWTSSFVAFFIWCLQADFFASRFLFVFAWIFVPAARDHCIIHIKRFVERIALSWAISWIGHTEECWEELVGHRFQIHVRRGWVTKKGRKPCIPSQSSQFFWWFPFDDPFSGRSPCSPSPYPTPSPEIRRDGRTGPQVEDVNADVKFGTRLRWVWLKDGPSHLPPQLAGCGIAPHVWAIPRSVWFERWSIHLSAIHLFCLRNGRVTQGTCTCRASDWSRTSRCLGVPPTRPRSHSSAHGKFPARWALRSLPAPGLRLCACPCPTPSTRSVFARRPWTYLRICPASPISFQT